MRDVFKSAMVFEYLDLEKLVEELYGQEINILHDMISEERRGHYTYNEFNVDGESELDDVGDTEIVKVWTETGQLKLIDISNDPEWDHSWNFVPTGDVEVRHILHRLFREGHISAGKYYMLVDW